MTTDAKGLRDAVVEGMAQAEYESDYPSSQRPTWENLAFYAKARYLRKAEAALDAALDVLGPHTVERSRGKRLWSAVSLLAVLRAGKSLHDDPSGKGSEG